MKGETSHTEKSLLSAKASKTSFFKLIDLKLFQERKKKRVQARCQMFSSSQSQSLRHKSSAARNLVLMMLKLTVGAQS